jgi:hypothetical protein
MIAVGVLRAARGVAVLQYVLFSISTFHLVTKPYRKPSSGKFVLGGYFLLRMNSIFRSQALLSLDFVVFLSL